MSVVLIAIVHATSIKVDLEYENNNKSHLSSP